MSVDAIVLVKTAAPVSDADLVRLNWRMAEACDRETFYDKPLSAVTVYEDGSGKWGTDANLEVCWGLRYYGPGYERGHWPTIYAVIRWLWLNFPGGTVYYGGDSSDVLEAFTPEKADAMWAHWGQHGGVPYQSFFNRSGRTVPCCGGNCFNVGGGGAVDFWSCPACGQRWHTEPNKEPFKVAAYGEATP